MAFKLQISSSRRAFKKRFGQANHFLITILVGLDGVKKDEIKISDEFSTSWNPKDKTSSAMRSARFALNSSLAWAVDNLDAYFILCHQKPTLFEDTALIGAMSNAGRHVHDKFVAIYKFLENNNVKDVIRYASLVELAIQWRNNTIHFGADNKLDKLFEDYLKNNKLFYKENFSGLDINETLNSFNNNKAPSFKEVTSMIAAIHKFVEIADSFFVYNINIDRYIKDLVDKYYSLNPQSRIKLPTFTLNRKKKLVKNLFLSNGFSEVESEESIVITEEFIAKVFDVTD